MHLRFLQSFPHVRTSCCSKWHCFRCKVKDFHVGQTCDEYQDASQSNLLTCSQCWDIFGEVGWMQLDQVCLWVHLQLEVEREGGSAGSDPNLQRHSWGSS